jgi:hypothetical protein
MSRITYYIAIGIKNSIKVGEYTVKDAKVRVAYPATLNIAPMPPIALPVGLSVFFEVSWDDPNDKDASQLRSKSFRRELPLYKALGFINEILLALKLVRIDHLAGDGLRAVGIGDTLFYTSKID